MTRLPLRLPLSRNNPEETMRRKHLILMLIGCALPMIALAAIFLVRVEISKPLLFALFLLCPLSHLLMLGAHGRGAHEAAHDSHQETDHV